MAEISREEIRERLGNIEQIRDIIFGPQLREYNTRMDKIESNISLLEKDMGDRIEQTKTALLAELREAVESLDKKIKSLSLNLQDENTETRQMIERTNKKFSSSIEALDQTVDQQTGLIKKDLSETKEKLLEDVRTLRSQLFEELEKRFSTLTDAKVARHDMAELLFEVGYRLKGTEFAPQLKEAAVTGQSDNMPLLEATAVSG